MRVFLLGIFIQALLAGILHGAVEFEPSLLESRAGTWKKTSGNYVGEHYVDYRYDGRVVFRVLERFVPAMSSMISQAKKVKGTLRLEDPLIIFFESRGQMEANFAVVVPKEDDRQVTIDPKALELDEISRCCTSVYFVKIGQGLAEFEVTREVYQSLYLAKGVARVEKKSLKIRLDNLANGKHKDCVQVVDIKKDYSQNCDICFERPKAILFEPCNHLLACEVCSPQIVDTCPTCRGNITSRKRIYF